MPAVSLGCLVKGVATYSSSATSFRFPAAFLRRPTISHRCFFNAGLTYLLTEASLRLRAGFLEKSAFSRKCLWAEVQAHILLAIRFRLAADFLQRRSAHGPFRNHFHTHVGPCDPPSGREPPAALQERVLKKVNPQLQWLSLQRRNLPSSRSTAMQVSLVDLARRDVAHPAGLKASSPPAVRKRTAGSCDSCQLSGSPVEPDLYGRSMRR
jgi:hypothetical protein